MIQDIEPKTFYNNFQPKTAQPGDLFLSYNDDTVLVREEKEELWYPSFSDFEQSHPHLINNARFLFSIDELNYFLTEEKGLDSVDNWTYVLHIQISDGAEILAILCGRGGGGS